MSDKHEWPETVGKTGEEAKAFIQKDTEGRGITVEIVKDGSPVTMDFREDRCRVFVDGNDKVLHPPCLG